MGVSPDPYRGWSRNVLARIRAQREPVVPPAGTGADYGRPQGVSRSAALATGHHRLWEADRGTPRVRLKGSGTRANGAIYGKRSFGALRHVSPERAHRGLKDRCAGDTFVREGRKAWWPERWGALKRVTLGTSPEAVELHRNARMGPDELRHPG